MRFADLLLILRGSSSGEQILKTAAAASGQITLPAGTTDFSGTGPGHVQQASAGAAFTVANTASSWTVGSPGAVSGGTLTGDVVAQRVILNNNTATAPASVSAATSLHLVGSDTVGAQVEITNFAGGTPTIVGRSASGTGASPSATNSGATLLNFAARGYGATGWSGGGRGAIQIVAAENFSDSAQGTFVRFYTTPIGGTALTAHALLGPGLTLGAPTGGDKGAGTLNATGVYANNVLLTSDERLKRDIEPVPADCLTLVEAIAPKRFKFIEPEPQPPPDEDTAPTPAGPPGWFDRTHWGFTAQDVERVIPEAVETDAAGNKYISPSDLTACLWSAVQQLSARVAELEARGAAGG